MTQILKKIIYKEKRRYCICKKGGSFDAGVKFQFLFPFEGLRSQKVGEQCEAIVRFPRLFEKYPFPILINSAFLKLADVFRDG